MRRIVFACLAAASLASALSCGRGGPRISPSEVAVVRVATLPDNPGDAAWKSAPAHPAALLLQDLVDPRLMEASTSRVDVQAITDGVRIAFRLSWSDPTHDDRPGPAQFPDSCAVQLPARIGRDVPAPQMGEAGKGVEISYWRASWQAEVDGRKDSIDALYPNAAVDHYPFEAASLPADSPERKAMALRYAPARALGNTMSGPRTNPVEDLIAEGPGTLKPAQTTRATGRGRRAKEGWEVVIARPLPEGLSGGARTQVAFAVWQGSHEEVGARKMRTPWIPIFVEAK